MDVTLPSGVILRNLPEGITDAQIAKRLTDMGYDANALMSKPQGIAAVANEDTGLERVLGNVKEFGKGIIPGAAGLAESSATGLAALLPEEYEDRVRANVTGLTDRVREKFKAAPGYEDSLGRTLGEGVGSTVPFFAAAALAPVTGSLAALGGGAALAASSGAGEARQRAEAAGASDEERTMATFGGAGVGSLEMVPAWRFLKKLERPIQNKLMGMVQRALVEGGEEAAQEVTSQFLQNAIEKGYDPTQDLAEGLVGAGGAGFGVGAIIQGVVDLAAGKHAPAADGTDPTAGETERKRELARMAAAAEGKAGKKVGTEAGKALPTVDKEGKPLFEMVGDTAKELTDDERKAIATRAEEFTTTRAANDKDMADIYKLANTLRAGNTVSLETLQGETVAKLGKNADLAKKTIQKLINKKYLIKDESGNYLLGDGTGEHYTFPGATNPAKPVKGKDASGAEKTVETAAGKTPDATVRTSTTAKDKTPMSPEAKLRLAEAKAKKANEVLEKAKQEKASADTARSKEQIGPLIDAHHDIGETITPQSIQKILTDAGRTVTPEEARAYHEEFQQRQKTGGKPAGGVTPSTPTDVAKIESAPATPPVEPPVTPPVEPPVEPPVTPGQAEAERLLQEHQARLAAEQQGQGPPVAALSEQDAADDAMFNDGYSTAEEMIDAMGEERFNAAYKRWEAKRKANAPKVESALPPVPPSMSPHENPPPVVEGTEGADAAKGEGVDVMERALGKGANVTEETTEGAGAGAAGTGAAGVGAGVGKKTLTLKTPRPKKEKPPVEPVADDEETSHLRKLVNDFSEEQINNFAGGVSPLFEKKYLERQGALQAAIEKWRTAGNKEKYKKALQRRLDELHKEEKRIKAAKKRRVSRKVTYAFDKDEEVYDVDSFDPEAEVAFGNMEPAARRDTLKARLMGLLGRFHTHPNVTEGLKALLQYNEVIPLDKGLDTDRLQKDLNLSIYKIDEGIANEEANIAKSLTQEQRLEREDQLVRRTATLAQALAHESMKVEGKTPHQRIEETAQARAELYKSRAKYTHLTEVQKWLHSALASTNIGKAFKLLLEDKRAFRTYPVNQRPLIHAVLQRLNELDFSNVETIVEGASTQNDARYADLFQQMRERGETAHYNPDNNTLVFTYEGMREETIAHELVHAGTARVLHLYETGGKLKPEQKAAAKHINALFEHAKKNTALANGYPNAFENVHEFVTHAMTNPVFQHALAHENAPALAKYTGEKSLWKQFMEAISKIFGLAPEGNVLAETAEAMSRILAKPESGIERAPLTMRTTPASHTTETPRETIKRLTDGVENPSRGKQMQTYRKWLFTKQGWDKKVTQLQNSRRALYLLQRQLDMSNRLDSFSEKFNNLNDYVTLSAGKAKDYMAAYLVEDHNELHKAINTYAKKTGLKVNEALGRLHLYTMARHEQERRQTKFDMNVPLKNDGTRVVRDTSNFIGGGVYAIGDFRELVLRKLYTDPLLGIPEAEARADPEKVKRRAERMRQAIRAIASDTRNLDPYGHSRAKISATKIEHDDFNVIGGYTQAQMEAFREMAETDANQTELNKIYKLLESIQNSTIELNRKSNYWSEYVDNIKAFYGWDHYVPFKGKPGTGEVHKSDRWLEINGSNSTGDWSEHTDAYGGRESDSDNPLLQVMADSARAALRAGRHGSTQALKNLIDQKHVKGRLVKTIKFETRFNPDFSIKEELGNRDTSKFIFNYVEGGDIEVVDVQDETIHEAFRRGFVPQNPGLDFMNSVTSTVGHMHTRYNFSFHPYNFIRDMLTNSYNVSAEFGPAMGARIVSAVASKVADGGLLTTNKVARLYKQGKTSGTDPKELTELVKNDPFAADVLDYLKQGGHVAYIQGLAVKGQLQDLYKDLTESKVATVKKATERVFDTWGDTFEIASRAASYSVMKQHFIAEARKKDSELKLDPATEEGKKNLDRIQAKAAAYVKNLANFEQIGEAGRMWGAWYMFFRPSATGVVRFIDALAPAFVPTNVSLSHLPDSIRFKRGEDGEFIKDESGNRIQDDEAIKNYRKAHETQKTHARIMVGVMLGMGVAMYRMAMLMADDDDEGRNRVATDDPAMWVRNARLTAPGLGKDKWLQLPWGFGMGAFAALGAQTAAWANGSQDWRGFFGNAINVMLDSFVPVSVSRQNPFDDPPVSAVGTILDTVTPSAVRPLFEYAMNKDGIGRDIRNLQQNKYGDTFTGGAHLPDIYMDTARWWAKVTDGKFGRITPEGIQFFLSNYLDGVAKFSAAGYGATLFAADLTDDPDIKTTLIPFTSFIGKDGNVDAREYEKVLKKVKETRELVDMWWAQGDVARAQRLLMDDERMAAYTVSRMQDSYANGALKTLQEWRNTIMTHPDLSRKEREELLRKNKEDQNFVKKQTITMFERILKNE